MDRNRFSYNQSLFKKISDKNFNDSDFLNLGENLINKITINSIKDNKKFEINAIELLYSLPVNSFTLINDEKNNIYLAKIINYQDKNINFDNKEIKEYINKQNSKNKQSILKSYDLLLNTKYDIVLNQKTIERVKNFFQ